MFSASTIEHMLFRRERQWNVVVLQSSREGVGIMVSLCCCFKAKLWCCACAARRCKIGNEC